MQLALTVPETWQVRTVGAQRIARLTANAVLAWGSLVPYPDDLPTWIRRTMQVDLIGAATVTIDAIDKLATNTGWPFRLVHAEIVCADGSIGEHRLGAFYRFLEYGAVAMVRTREAAARDAIRAQVLTVLATGRPDWQADGLPVCLHDLFGAHRRHDPSAR